MELKTRMNSDATTTEALKTRGLQFRSVGRDRVMATLPKAKGDKAWDVPTCVQAGRLLMELSETGGGHTGHGDARVIAGMSGKPMFPFYKPAKVAGCESVAFFTSAQNAVTVDVTVAKDGKETATLTERIITIDGRTAKIEKVVLWKGKPSELPITFGRFADAVKAAIAKAKCYHCTCVHFEAEREERRPRKDAPKKEGAATTPTPEPGTLAAKLDAALNDGGEEKPPKSKKPPKSPKLTEVLEEAAKTRLRTGGRAAIVAA